MVPSAASTCDHWRPRSHLPPLAAGGHHSVSPIAVPGVPPRRYLALAAPGSAADAASDHWPGREGAASVPPVAAAVPVAELEAAAGLEVAAAAVAADWLPGCSGAAGTATSSPVAE